MDLSVWPTVSRCCCCFSLRTGSLIIGYVSLLVSSLSLAIVSISLYEVVKFVVSHKDKPPSGHTVEEMATVALSLYITHAYFLLVLLYYFIISLLLVIGVHKNKSNYLGYYFNAAIVLLVLGVALVVVTCVFFGFIATIPLLIWCTILFYFLIVVRSTHLEMVELSKPRVYEMQNLYSTQAAPLMT